MSVPTLPSEFLRLPPEWTVGEVEIGQQVVTVHAFAELGEDAICAVCNATDWERGRDAARWLQGLPVCGRSLLIRLHYRSRRCRVCRRRDKNTGPRPPPSVGALGNAKFVPALRAEIGELGLRLPALEVARILRVPRNGARDILVEESARALAEWTPPAVRALGIDGVRACSTPATLMTDLDTARVVGAAPSQSSAKVVELLRTLPARPDVVVTDFAHELTSAVRRAWPGIPHVIDRYHVTQLVARRVERYRKAYSESRMVPGGGLPLRASGTAASWVGTPHGERHTFLVQAYLWRDALSLVFEAQTAEEAQGKMNAWQAAMPPQLFPYLCRQMPTLRRWSVEICAHVTWRLPVGRTEATNRRVAWWSMTANRQDWELFRARIILGSSAGDRWAEDSVLSRERYGRQLRRGEDQA